MVRHRNHDGVDVFSGQHFPIVMVWLAILVFVKSVDGVERLLEMICINVAGGDNLAIIQLHERIRIPRSLIAPTEDAHDDPFRGSGFASEAQGAGGDEGGHGDGRPCGTGQADKPAAADICLLMFWHIYLCFCNV